MILALDIGNTHIVLGCMEGRRIRYLCRMATNRLTTGAEYAVTISRLLEFGHIAPDAFDGAIISSARNFLYSSVFLWHSLSPPSL